MMEARLVEMEDPDAPGSGHDAATTEEPFPGFLDDVPNQAGMLDSLDDGLAEPFFPPQQWLGTPPTEEELKSAEHRLRLFDDFLYHGEIRDFIKGQLSFERISSSLGTEDLDSLIPPCLEVLEFANPCIRSDTLLCLMYISLGCSLCCDLHSFLVVSAMQTHAGILSRHGSLSMFVRALDSLLCPDVDVSEDVMVERAREMRLILNCIYLQLLFTEEDADLALSLELGQGSLGSSLVSLLFEALKLCSDTNKHAIPIKKVILLLLLVLQKLLNVPDEMIMPTVGIDASDVQSELQAPLKLPRIKEFQAFTGLHIHEQSLLRKYWRCGRPAAIAEGLQIIHRYKDEFIANYPFHPSEVRFMQKMDFMQASYSRYKQLHGSGKDALSRQRVGQTAESHGRWRAEEWAQRLSSDVHVNDVESSTGAGDDQSMTDFSEESGSEMGSVGSESTQASTASTVDTILENGAQRADDAVTPDQQTNTVQGTDTEPVAQDGKTLRDKNLDATKTFHRLYFAIRQKLAQAMVLLLRLLLTSCSNVENYPGVVDMARERQAAHALYNAEDMTSTERAIMPLFDKTLPSESVEALRDREIMASAVSGVILILLKRARKASVEPFSSLAQLITDSNGALVVLKFLNQDLSAALETPKVPPVLACLRTRASSTTHPSWLACATLRLVEVLYLLCKDSPERVRRYLVHYKAPLILKRLHKIESPQVQKLVLKLLKKQVRYLPRKWKQANMKSISAMYTLIRMSPLDDWLLNEQIGDTATEGPSQQDIRSSNVAYNSTLMASGPQPGLHSSTSSPQLLLRVMQDDVASTGVLPAMPLGPSQASMGRQDPAERGAAVASEVRSRQATPGGASKGTTACARKERRGYASAFPEFAPAYYQRTAQT
mmetsp:Transcript_65850/g.157370  ORF Transcript_65850/g.157370 Transcript_65850/m.157370 type:complete len:887 (-) Transcript_65850:25-2685(-)